jgi:hypothetical protein
VYCPQCHKEYSAEMTECPDCSLALADGSENLCEEEADLDALIRTDFSDPIAVGLAKSLLREAGIPYFDMDQSLAARQESGNWLNWWSIRVPRERADEVREILAAVRVVGE